MNSKSSLQVFIAYGADTIIYYYVSWILVLCSIESNGKYETATIITVAFILY